MLVGINGYTYKATNVGIGIMYKINPYKNLYVFKKNVLYLNVYIILNNI